MDLGTGLYLNRYQGGLYPDGLNAMPANHYADGLAAAAQVQPVNGKIVLLAIGMSNITDEFCHQGSWKVGQACDAQSFIGKASTDSAINSAVVPVDGAEGEQTAYYWTSNTMPGHNLKVNNYDRIRDSVLAPQGLTESQVQVVYLKDADSYPSVRLPNSNADAWTYEAYLGQIARTLKVRYPNLHQLFISTRIYAGYADPVTQNLNPEPYAYEYGFAAKWFIAAQITQIDKVHH